MPDKSSRQKRAGRSQSTASPKTTAARSPAPQSRFSEQEKAETLPKILELVHSRTGHDFSQYKASTMLRRIVRRQQVYRLDTPGEYLQLLIQRPEEVETLFQHLLVGVTCFFRDPEAFAVIEKRIIPELISRRAPGEPLRMWVAGCATGEEAYSLAMIAIEAFQKAKIRRQLQIFATDIDAEALAAARRGQYPEEISATISKDRLRKFFQRQAGGYRVKDELRNSVRFAEHDIIRDPPFGGMHLISCRNVMIYLERGVQERVYDIFHYALKPDGYLWLGPSESIEGGNELFAVQDKKQRLFQRRPTPRANRSAVVPQVVARDVRVRPAGRPQGEVENSLGQLHERVILLQHSPASVIVNDNFDIIHTVGDTSPYLTIPPGDPTHNLMKVARKGLRMALRAGLHQVFTQQKECRVENLRVQAPGADVMLTLIVKPISELPLLQPHAMVVFERLTQAPPSAENVVMSAGHGVDPVIDQLDDELQQARRQLQATVEAYETSNEELQSSNEELRSMNEELQSATEELEAGKEEFQAMNEELSSVNQTLKTKIDELSRANSDLRNFLTATDIGTMFLDRDLCVIRYTPRIKDVFNIIASDKGRPLSHLTHTLEYDTIEEDARQVLEHLETVEREVPSSGRWFLVRILPYRTVEEQIGGVVLTLIDITERKRLEQELQFDADILARIADAVVAVDQHDRITYLNAAAALMYRIDPQIAIGKPFSELTSSEWISDGSENEFQSDLVNYGYAYGHFRHLTRDGRKIPVDITISTLMNVAGMPVGKLSVIRDVSERQRVLDALEESEERLRRVTDAVPGAVYKLVQTAAGRRFSFISQGCVEVVGFTSEQLRNNSGLLFDLVLPPDSAALQDSMRESAETMQPFVSEFRIRTREGRTRWLTMRAQPHSGAEGAIIWNGFLLDSTERREREDFVRSIYEGVESLIAVVDVGADGQFRITDLNPAYQRLTEKWGVPFKGKTFDDLRSDLSEDMIKTLRLRYQQCLDTGESIQFERKIEIRDQSDWYLTRLSPLRDPQGHIFRIISISTAITETKRQEEEQLRSSKLEALGVLAGGLAHDFNNIIMGISLNLDLLLNEMPSDDPLVDIVRESSYATTRAGELSRRLLAFAKGGKPVKQVIDLKAALRSVVDFALTGSSLRAQYFIDPDLECVDADLGQISQVFDNLVINAREACRDGGLLEVRAGNVDLYEDQISSLKRGRYVRVEIQDHGPGIPRDIIDKIFDPYFTTKAGGNGIGLATCYTTLRNHDGVIMVDSEEGAGSTFSVYLPVAEGRKLESVPLDVGADFGTARLLLIDDDSLILSTMSRALRLHGYHIETVPEGAEGARLYRTAMERGEAFDFVLLDANIPGGLGGEAALRAIQEVDPNARVILCSGYSASNLLSDWEACGFRGRLQKPFSVYDVGNIIRKIQMAG